MPDEPQTPQAPQDVKNRDRLSPREIAELFEITHREGAALRQLTVCVEDLQKVQDAKKSLQGLSTDEVRAALAYLRTNNRTDPSPRQHGQHGQHGQHEGTDPR